MGRTYIGDESGAAAAEYALLLVLICAGLLLSAFALRGAIAGSFDNSSSQIAANTGSGLSAAVGAGSTGGTGGTTSGTGGTTGGTGGTTGGTTSPGNSGNAPGHTGAAPGLGGSTPPGQSGANPGNGGNNNGNGNGH